MEGLLEKVFHRGIDGVHEGAEQFGSEAVFEGVEDAVDEGFEELPKDGGKGQLFEFAGELMAEFPKGELALTQEMIEEDEIAAGG